MVAENPPNLVDFWNAFRSNVTEIKAGSVINLPPDVFILGNPQIGSSLFVRECYTELLKMSLSIMETQYAIILGNPGIGKTFFGYLMLFHFARSNAIVVYEEEKKRYLFSPNMIASGNANDFIGVLEESTTYYIVDAVAPGVYPAKTILLSSLRREIWYKFNKVNTKRRFMPMWTKQEIQTCRSLLFPKVLPQKADQLFDRWGGVPRYVLKYADDPDQQMLFEGAISSVKLDVLLECIGNTEASDEASHRLVHIHPSADFVTTTYRFASNYAADGVYQRFYDENRTKLTTFLAVSHGKSDVAGVRGGLFERYVHNILAEGGTFRIRELLPSDGSHKRSATAISTLTLPRLEMLVFDTDAEVTNEATAKYFRPRIPNYESVDSFIKPDTLFQVTVSGDHPCKQVGLHTALNLLGDPPNPILYFVVPQDRFDGFKYRSYEGADGHALKDGPSYVNVKRVKQFVLAIDLYSSGRPT